MINPFLVTQLRHASNIFKRRGQPAMAHAALYEIGRMTDTMNPDETEAHRLVNLANGSPIHA